MTRPVIADSVTLEPDDVRILRALQIDPRVGFATVATVLGLSEPTVARRYRRMRRAGAIRVVGVVDPGALGQSRWMVRLRCRPGSATAIAEALAQRDDVGWVALGAAGSEVTCAVRSRSQEQRDDLLGRRLPRTAAVLDLQASVLLRQFIGGRGHYRARANLWLRVRPAEIKTVGRAMAQMPEVGFAAAVSGPYNLHAVVHCHDLDRLFEFTTDRVGTLPGVEGLETSPVLRQVKQAGTRVDGDRLGS
ncbi:Lrp/AsnC family transcriptional regulator [Streptomyces sp. DB-54]